MIRWMGALLMAFALAACGDRVLETYPVSVSSPYGLATPDDELMQRMALLRQVAAPSVQVLSVDGTGSGSGVVVHQNATRALVVTAWHVVRPRGGAAIKNFVVTRHDHDPLEATVVQFSAESDLALVRTAPKWPVVAALFTPTPRSTVGWGSRVVTFGYPVAIREGMLTDGRITSVDDHGTLRYSAPTFYGNSGGGVFVHHGERWELLSICQTVGGHTGGQGEWMSYPHMGRGARPDVLLKFLEGVERVR